MLAAPTVKRTRQFLEEWIILPVEKVNGLAQVIFILVKLEKWRGYASVMYLLCIDAIWIIIIHRIKTSIPRI